MLIHISALALLAAAGCTQTGYGYRAQTAALPEAQFDNAPQATYVTNRYYRNPAISSFAQERLYSHQE
jgi:hypothetical protein